MATILSIIILPHYYSMEYKNLHHPATDIERLWNITVHMTTHNVRHQTGGWDGDPLRTIWQPPLAIRPLVLKATIYLSTLGKYILLFSTGSKEGS
jgi:hypothetical protein